MNIPGSLFLVGPMGAGKSTIGRQLAKRLSKEFHDSDHEIEARTGVDIPLIFELEGEEGFRKREQAVVEELTRIPGIILATGGGAILDAENRRNLRTRGQTVYLHASVNQQLKRTRRDRNRPLLQAADPRARLEELMAIREPLYREIADLIIETDGKRVRDVVSEIILRLQ
jgi:shikimate kinase